MGISQKFLLLSAEVSSKYIKILDENELEGLGVVTGGETPVEWTMQARNNTLYVRGERDSIYGHHKVMITKIDDTFLFHAVIEAQGRDEQLKNFPVVEIVTFDEIDRIDIADRCMREIFNTYLNVICKITSEEARLLLHSKGFGVQIRGSTVADMFLGIAPMSTAGAEDLLTSFYRTVAPGIF